VIQDARIHYAITNTGGFSPNVVQPQAEVLYLIRAPKSHQVEEIYQRVNKIAQGAALMTETALEIQFVKACADVIPNKTLSQVMYENFQGLEIPDYTREELELAKEIRNTLSSREFDMKMFSSGLPPEQALEYAALLKDRELCDILIPYDKNYKGGQILPGSSDVGDVSWNTPTAQICTACYAVATPAHSWQLVSQTKTSAAHKGLLLAAKVIAGSVIDVFENPELLNLAKEELSMRLGGEVYRCAIPDDVKPRAIGRI
jgi:aminobenzoyl-glutamate utilization protein B